MMMSMDVMEMAYIAVSNSVIMEVRCLLARISLLLLLLSTFGRYIAQVDDDMQFRMWIYINIQY